MAESTTESNPAANYFIGPATSSISRLSLGKVGVSRLVRPLCPIFRSDSTATHWGAAKVMLDIGASDPVLQHVIASTQNRDGCVKWLARVSL